MTTETGTPRWVFIERGNFGVADHPHPRPDVYIGPFTGPNADEDAATCMNESLLVDHLMQREGGGGTDCYVTTEQPDNDRDDVYIIDHDDPYHTGKKIPYLVTLRIEAPDRETALEAAEAMASWSSDTDERVGRVSVGAES
jgi:hypothetical protein